MRPKIDRRIQPIPVLSFLIISMALCPAVDLARAGGWEYEVGLKCTYDNNILNYSDADIDLYDSIGSTTGGQFGIESKDDFIFSPSLGIKYKSSLLGHTFQTGFVSIYNFNVKNDLCRYYSGTIWVREYLRKGAYLQAKLKYIPEYYYRNLQAYDAAYREAVFSKLGADLTLNLDLAKKIASKAYLAYEQKDFSRFFDERDLKTYRFGIELIYRFSGRLRAVGGYEFSISKSEGRNSEVYRRDTSYDQFSFWGGTRLAMDGISGKRLLISPRLGYRHALYQTAKLTWEDRFRFGRKDTRLRASLDLRQTLGDRIDLLFGAAVSSNEADLPANDVKRFLDYTSFTINIGFDYSF